MVCTKCGKNLPDGSAFCQYCGNPIASSDTLEHNEQLQSQTNTIEQNQAEQNIDNANTNQVEQTTEAPRPTYVRPQIPPRPTYVRPQQVQQNSYAQPIQNNFAQPTYTQQPQQVQQNNYAQPSQPSYVRPQQIQQNNYAQPVQTQQNSGYSQNNYAPPPPQAPVQRQATGWRKTLSKISVILALSGAVLAFIFTFFIGESSNYNTISNASSSTAKNIYFFFGKAYSEMNNVFNNYGSSLTDISKTAYTLYCVFGTLISITCLVLPIIFAILATVHSIKYLTGKSYNSPIRYCVYTVISFIGCAMLFATLVCGSQSTHSSYQSISVTVTLNEATIAGIVLTLIALLSVISMTIIAKPREYFVKKNVITLCFNAGKILLLAVSCAFVVETMSFIISSNSSSGDIRLNNMQILMLIVSMFSSPYSYNQYQSNANLALVFTIFSLLLNVAIIILLCISLSKAIVNIDKESNNKSLLIDIFNSSASLLCIIMDIIIIIQLQPIMGNNTTGVPVFMIIYLVMSLLVMGVTIAKKIISSKLRY